MMKYLALLKAIEILHRNTSGKAVAAVNRWLVLRNWVIGAYLIEFEQNGEERAAYGERLLERVADDLKKRKIRGLGISTLKSSRQFYRLYHQIRQSLPGESSLLFPAEIRQSPIGESNSGGRNPSRAEDGPTLLDPERILSLSWTRLLELIRMEDPWKRAFYENQCLSENWSVRQLQRQIGSMLYERTGLSTDKKAVIAQSRKPGDQTPASIADLIRDPYVLEFVGLAEKSAYRESDLETALLDHLQAFLPELGAGTLLVNVTIWRGKTTEVVLKEGIIGRPHKSNRRKHEQSNHA